MVDMVHNNILKVRTFKISDGLKFQDRAELGNIMVDHSDVVENSLQIFNVRTRGVFMTKTFSQSISFL